VLTKLPNLAEPWLVLCIMPRRLSGGTTSGKPEHWQIYCLAARGVSSGRDLKMRFHILDTVKMCLGMRCMDVSIKVKVVVA